MASRLLVADDSITIQKIVSMAFENEDVEVEGVGDGQEAFHRIPEFNPDIVLADVDMPGLNGFELSTKIKESPKTNNIQVLLLASDFEDFDEQRYKACGANNHISKPFKSDDIVAMVKSMLNGLSDDDIDHLEIDLVENHIESSDLEITKQPEDNVKLASEFVDSLKVPKSQEEPSLEELLDSVEKLSTDGMKTSVFEDDGKEEISERGTRAVVDREPELNEPLELSTSDEVLDLLEDDSIDPKSFNTEKDLDATLPLSESDDDIMDQMISGVEELKKSVKIAEPEAEETEVFLGDDLVEPEDYIEEPEIFSEVRPRKMDDIDDLNSTFKELAMGSSPGETSEEENRPELSSLGGIVPEPEDLLERIAPGAFSEAGRRHAIPDDIKDSLDYISEFPSQDKELNSRNLLFQDCDYETGDKRFTQAIASEVKQVLERDLGISLKKEVSGLSEVILKTIQEVVREVTPEVVRGVIREEIEKIKKQDKY
jgi:CheY-like chemotaxis protein